MDENKFRRDTRDISKDFQIDDSIFNAEPDKIRRVKEIVLRRLDPVERAIILLYADCGSLRKLGKRLDLSYVSVKGIVDPIKAKILDAYYEMAANELNEELKRTK